MTTPFGIVVHDEEGFLSKVVNRGMEQGIFTSDRADEIIRISVAMANKYVLHNEIDFRSTEELAKVQETILKLIGVGLEIKCDGKVDQGVAPLMEQSPVDFFRVAHTRVERLRSRWEQLLLDHHVKILIDPAQYKELTDFAQQRLSEMSIFSEVELETIRALTLEDRLFSSLDVLSYYESELSRYQFILRLKDLLPFELLKKSKSVHAETLSEVDSIREALVNTLIISGFVDSDDPVVVTMADIRAFLAVLDSAEHQETFPAEIEDVVVDLIHELAEDLDEADAQLFTREIVRIAQELLATVTSEWDTVTSPSQAVFFKRWSRMAILSDVPDPLERILATAAPLDEFDFELLYSQLLSLPEDRARETIERIPWTQMVPDQIIRLFQEIPQYQVELSESVSINGFHAADLVDFLETLTAETFERLLPDLRKAVQAAHLTLEDLEVVADLPHKERWELLRMSGPPSDFEPEQIVAEFPDAHDKARRVFFYTSWKETWFPELFRQAWDADREFVKKFAKGLNPADIGPFLQSAAGDEYPRIEKLKTEEPTLKFESQELNGLFRSLAKSKKKAAVAHFRRKA